MHLSLGVSLPMHLSLGVSLPMHLSLPVHSSSLPPLCKLRRNIFSGLKFNSIPSRRRVSRVYYSAKQEISPFKEIRNKEPHESLLAKIRNMFCNIDDMSCQNPQHIGKMLSLLDVIYSMGISRHFRAEIRQTLDVIFSAWKDNIIVTRNLNNLALAFLMLRLHRYDVAPDVFGEFTDQNGNLDIEVSTMEGLITTLNVFRASIVQFPNEQILKETHTFCLLTLKEWLSKTTKYPKHLIEEVRYALAYPWQLSSPRWEALNFIRIYSANIKWLRCPLHKSLLELAKLDYNMIQEIHKHEIKELYRQVVEQVRHVKVEDLSTKPACSYLIVALGIFEPELSDLRIILTKAIMTIFILDDIYEYQLNVNQVKEFTEAIRRQRLSMKETFSKEVKICFNFVMETYKEITNSCSTKQGYNMEQILLPKWVRQLEAFELEARWFAKREIPSTEEYLRNGCESVSVWPIFTIARLLTFKFSCHPKDLETELKNNIEFYKVCAQTVRLHNDLYEEFNMKSETSTTKEISIVDCYMKERPWEKREDVTKALQKMVRKNGKTLSKLFLDPREIGDNERMEFELTRAVHFLYKRAWCFTSYAGDKALDLKECVHCLFFQEIV